MMIKRLSILGSTGSIGQNALDVIARFPDRFQVVALAAGRNVDLLAEQVGRFRPRLVAVMDEVAAAALQKLLPDDSAPEVLSGRAGAEAAATLDEADLVLSAIVGAAGLPPTYAAVAAGKTVALANKETLVMAGDLVMGLAREKDVAILPVDSEHSALFQCLQGQPRRVVDRLILTASGGPFWQMDPEDLSAITPEQALDHPRWDMGPRVTVDSATLMNKGLELLEAHHLFDQPLERISILIHPQAVVHSMVRFTDGQLLSQMGPADMRLPIAYALSYPERLPLELPPSDLALTGPLTFFEPDRDKFPCLTLAREAAREGGAGPTVLNAADEVAVAAFLAGRIGFRDIPAVVARVLADRPGDAPAGIEDVLAVDRWARMRAEEEIQKA